MRAHLCQRGCPEKMKQLVKAMEATQLLKPVAHHRFLEVTCYVSVVSFLFFLGCLSQDFQMLRRFTAESKTDKSAAQCS